MAVRMEKKSKRSPHIPFPVANGRKMREQETRKLRNNDLSALRTAFGMAAGGFRTYN